ncbi:MAG: leucine-rich repeat domain-containing protein [Paludibacteraceae bacterium]|nr:leucine-rich repeat domain-containing protein [Paludibacteraceae bacterium]
MRKLFFLLVALFATTCLWAYTFEVNGIYYNYLDGNNVEVTYNNSINAEKYSGEVIIPSTITYNRTTYNVTSIGSQAFWKCSSLSSITIPNSVTSIGNSAFSSCSSLSSITIPNSVTSIGNDAFYNCSSLTSITIPNSVTSIGNSAFSQCSSLFSITIPNSVTSIGNYAFSRCSSLTSVTIPNSVTSIGNYAFSDCSSLTSITIPENVTSIGSYAFSGCTSLTSITIPESVTSIGNSAFRGCTSLTSMVVESGNTIYDSRENCNAIIETAINTLIAGCKNTTIPNNVTSIGNRAFSDCSSLTSITIPENVTSIGSYAFSGCTSLTSMVVESGNTIYDSRENSNAIIETATNTLIAGCKNTTIPNNVTSIGNNAFSDCSSLTSITIPESVTSIGNWAFSYCSSITSITIPESVTSIGNFAFFNCSSLTSISIPNNLTSIGCAAFTATPWLMNQPEGLLYFGNILYTYVGDIPKNAEIVIKEGTTIIVGGAFQGGDHNKSTTQNITSFTIPQSVKFIGENAFSSSIIQDSLKINYLGNMENWCDIVFENQSANPLNIRLLGSNEQTKLYINDSIITELVIPNTIDSIHDYTFYGYRALTSVTIPKNVKFIGREAFYNCGIKDVYLQSTTPPTLSKKSRKNFSSNPVCYIPCGAQAEYAASDWARQVEYFEEYYPYSLSIASSNEDWGAVEEPTCEGGIIIKATPKIGYQFVTWSDGNTDNPRKLELTQDTTLVAEFAQAFSGQCGDNLYWSYDENSKAISISGTGNMYDYTPTTQPWILFKEELKEVAIANTATSLGKSAFAGSIRLAKVEIGANVENIADSVFAGCNRLYHVYCYPTYPPFAEQSSFANYNVYLHVPCEEKEAYELDMIWGNFKNIECIGAESENITTDDVIVSPSTDNVTITWPTEDNADTYSIVIEKDNEVFCTLTFHADGLLLNIAFAPARNGSHHAAQYAAQTAKGMRFTVTGLEEATTYAYNITAKDASDKTIKSHSGEFTTQSNTPTSVENTEVNSSNVQKLLRNGQLLILREGKTYNAMGTEIK